MYTLYQPAPGNMYEPPVITIEGKLLNAVDNFKYLVALSVMMHHLMQRLLLVLLKQYCGIWKTNQAPLDKYWYSTEYEGSCLQGRCPNFTAVWM